MPELVLFLANLLGLALFLAQTILDWFVYSLATPDMPAYLFLACTLILIISHPN